jgi:hypothetical protein
MVQSHDQSSLARRPSNLPLSSRNLSTRELEEVIRRAAELQAESSARLEEGLSEAGVLRIGRELGLDPATVRRAMAEVRGRQAVEKGVLVTLAGPRTVRASRLVNRPAARVAADLELYLRESEFMLAQRRLSDRTRFVRDSSFGAGLARFARGLARSPHPPVDLKQIDVSISPVDADSCLLELSADLAGTRGGLVGGVIGGTGGAAAAWATVAWATALPDPLMLLGVPVLAGAWFGTRAIFSTVRKSVQEKIESLLDRVEHDKLS